MIPKVYIYMNDEAYRNTKPVVIVVNTFGRGGAEMSLAVLANELAKKGRNVSYVALWRGTGCYNFDWLERNSVTLHTLCESRNILCSFFRLFKLLRQIQPEVIYSAMLDANLVSQMCSFLLRIPHIASVRCNPAQFYKESLPKNLAFMCVMLFQDNIVFISNRALQDCLSTSGGALLRRKRLFVLHNPISNENGAGPAGLVQKFTRTVGKINGVAADAPLRDLSLNLVMVSRLVEGKGIMETLEHLRLPFRNQGLHLAIYGAGPLEKRIRDYIAAEFSNNNVVMHGFCSDLDKIFEESDILIFPSRNEGFGRVPFEALLRGTLVLCNRDSSIVNEFLKEPTAWINYQEPLDLLNCIGAFACLDPQVCAAEVNTVSCALDPSAHAIEFDKITAVCVRG